MSVHQQAIMIGRHYHLMIILAFLSGYIESKKTDDDCKPMTIQCICGIGENLKLLSLELKGQPTKNSSNGDRKCDLFPDPYQACAEHSCTFSLNRSNKVDRKEFDIFLKSFYPQKFTIPRRGLNRFTRQTDPCHIKSLENAEITCWKWPNWINCDIDCIHGYAFQDSRETLKKININCRLTEDRWKPFSFKDCQPYVNCKAHLVKPGELNCKELIHEPAYCDISCLDYDGFDATSKKRYKCSDNKFDRTLPHCAVLKENVKLIRKPK